MLGRAVGSGARRGLGLARASVVQVRQLHATGPARKEEEPLPPSITEKFKLTDPTRYVPLTVGGFSLASLTGLYHFDAESQLLALWVLFCGTVYSRGGPLIAEMIDESTNAIAKEHAELEKAEIEAVKVALEANQRQVAIFDDIRGLFESSNALLAQSSVSADYRLKTGIRKAIVSRLDTLVQTETKIEEATRKILVARATASVKAAYLDGKVASLKENALEAALLALSNPSGATKDKTVGSLYTKYFADFRKNLETSAKKEITLSAAEIKEIKEFAEGVARRESIDASAISVPEKFSLA